MMSYFPSSSIPSLLVFGLRLHSLKHSSLTTQQQRRSIQVLRDIPSVRKYWQELHKTDLISSIGASHQYVSSSSSSSVGGKSGRSDDLMLLGFVPTMGALHEGHISLVRHAQRKNKNVMVSIFVNPTQFSKGEDFDKYPRQLQRDLDLLKKAGVSSAFCPDLHTMYPSQRLCTVEAGALTISSLEGRARPDFFGGVATVVTKLFNIVRPDASYFGQKDVAQCVLIRRMAQDLNMNVDVEVCETMRANDGLALSSRNAYLSADERAAAPVVYRALLAGKEAVLKGSGGVGGVGVGGYVDRKDVVDAMEKVLWDEPFVHSIEYISLASHEDMAELERVHASETGAVISMAVRLCNPKEKKGRDPKTMVRLIDNVLCGSSEVVLGLSKRI